MERIPAGPQGAPSPSRGTRGRGMPASFPGAKHLNSAAREPDSNPSSFGGGRPRRSSPVRARETPPCVGRNPPPLTSTFHFVAKRTSLGPPILEPVCVILKRAIALRTQTNPSGDAGPVSALLGRMGSPAVCCLCQVRPTCSANPRKTETSHSKYAKNVFRNNTITGNPPAGSHSPRPDRRAEDRARNWGKARPAAVHRRS